MESKNSTPQQEEEKEDKYKSFQCKICLEVAKEPIITPCGHLYCWECIYFWGEECKKKGQQITCPACKNVVDLDKVTSIYTGDDNGERKKREVPKRPQAEREEPRQNQNNNNGGGGFFGNNFQFMFLPGIFGLFNGFNFTFNMGGGGNNFNNNNGRRRWQHWLPFIIIGVQIALGLLSNSFSYNENSAYDDYYETNRERSRQNTFNENFQRKHKLNQQQRQQRQQRYTSNTGGSRGYRQQNNILSEYIDSSQVWFFFISFGIILLLFFLNRFINKNRNNNQNNNNTNNNNQRYNQQQQYNQNR